MAPCQLFRLQKRARRNDPNSLKGMQCKQVRIAGHNVSRLAAYSERKKLVILRIAAGGYLHIEIEGTDEIVTVAIVNFTENSIWKLKGGKGWTGPANTRAPQLCPPEVSC